MAAKEAGVRAMLQDPVRGLEGSVGLAFELRRDGCRR